MISTTTTVTTNSVTNAVTVTVNEAAGQEAIQRAKALLSNIPGGVKMGVKTAMGRAVQRVRGGANQAIREKYDISDANIRAEKNVRVRYKTHDGVTAYITFSGRKIPLHRYGGSSPAVPTPDIAAGKVNITAHGREIWTYQGVRARGHQFRSTGPSPISHSKSGEEAFVAQMKSGHIGIFARTGGETSDGSDAIEENMGSSVAQMIGSEEVSQRLTEEAFQTFETELDKAVYRILTGWR